jgi:hypothetical protein
MRHACAVCRRIVTDYRASVLPDGRIEVLAQCHGQAERMVIIVDRTGVLFHDGSVLELETRDPDEFVRSHQGRQGSAASPQ